MDFILLIGMTRNTVLRMRWEKVSLTHSFIPTHSCLLTHVYSLMSTHSCLLTHSLTLSVGGEALTVIDPNEAWMFHIIPDDTKKSAVWVAQRVPDDHISVVANQFVIREVIPNHPDFMYSGAHSPIRNRLHSLAYSLTHIRKFMVCSEATRLVV